MEQPFLMLQGLWYGVQMQKMMEKNVENDGF